jgi:hypothetical protein
MRAKVPASKTVDRSQFQIGWMRGITLAKRRKSSGSTPIRAGSKDSTMFGQGFHGPDWTEPETIQEEFVRISNQLPNVKWESIDMDTLTLNASLKGPWGTGSETIFIKVKVDIPANYPRSKAPKFVIESTSLMPDATRQKIEKEVHQIANEFLKRKENCLDVVFTYLLGEMDLEASTAFFKNVRDLDDDIDGLADESSSDDEDGNDVPAGGSASMSQELTASTELDPTTTLAATQRLTVPPLPRYCGARFSNDGRLVCFFPTRESKALFSVSAPDTNRDRSRGEPTFAGFGRLAQESPPPKQRYVHDETSATEDKSGDSDDSDSSTSSSDSQMTTMHNISLWYQPGRHFRKTWSANDSVRSSGGGTGAGTGTGTGTSRRRPGKPKNVISIHDLRETLPSKKQLAEEYAIFGDGSEVCEHNAEVAKKCGYPDMVHIWKYAALLLRKDIPLELHEQRSRNESVLVIAKDVVSRRQDQEDDGHIFSGRVKWGRHPLAQSFVDDLFDYFEKIADIQMLAMLSCIFGDSSAEDSVAIAESHLSQPETPLPMKAPSFSLEYFPTDPALWNINYKSQASSAITTPRTANTPAIHSDSPGSDDLAWLEPAPTSYSAGETPPRSAKEQLRDGSDQAQSLSTSPDNRHLRRSNSTVTSAFAASLPRTLVGMVSASPPDPPSRKRPSPAETILSNFAPSNITWGGSTVFGAASEITTAPRASGSTDDQLQQRREDLMTMVPVGVSCIPENQGLFDDDGWLSIPLLSAGRAPLYASYRYAYAELLHMWKEPLARLEIMKFNVLKEDSPHGGLGTAESSYHEAHAGAEGNNPSHGTGTTSPAIPFGGRKEQLQALIASNRGLDVTGICLIHETQLDPLEYSRPTGGLVGGAVGTCQRCQLPPNRGAGPVLQTKLRCVYCAEPVDALYPTCLSCGCASHEGCLAEWHAAGETECPAGDECRCIEEASNGQVESWPALQAAVAIAKARAAASIAEKAGRPRRTSVPAKLSGMGEGDDDIADGYLHLNLRGRRNRKGGNGTSSASLYGGDDDVPGREDSDWESIGSSHHSGATMSSATAFLLPGIKPPPVGDEPVSAARLSLNNRLKKSLAETSRPSAVRRKSGGVASWKKTTGLG